MNKLKANWKLALYPKITALLTAKGTPKHFEKVLGVPLVSYPAIAGRNSKLITEWYCASESEEILKLAYSHSYHSIKIPERLAGPKGQHQNFIEYALADMKELPDILVVILGNTVCIKPEWIDGCIKLLQDNPEASAVVPVIQDNNHHPLRAKRLNVSLSKKDNGYLENFDIQSSLGPEVSSNRQDLEPCYFLAHNFWVIKATDFWQGEPPWNFLGPKVLPWSQPGFYIDVHTEHDLTMSKWWLIEELTK